MKKQSGFTLLEVMVSMVLFGMVSATMAPIFTSQIRYNTRSERKTAAIEAAQQILDELRGEDPSTFPGAGAETTHNITIDQKNLTVIVSYCRNVTHCTINSRHLTAEVYLSNEKIYSVETVFTKLQ